MSYLILFIRNSREIAYATRPTMSEALILAEDLTHQDEVVVVREISTSKVVKTFGFKWILEGERTSRC